MAGSLRGGPSRFPLCLRHRSHWTVLLSVCGTVATGRSVCSSLVLQPAKSLPPRGARIDVRIGCVARRPAISAGSRLLGALEGCIAVRIGCSRCEAPASMSASAASLAIPPSRLARGSWSSLGAAFSSLEAIRSTRVCVHSRVHLALAYVGDYRDLAYAGVHLVQRNHTKLTHTSMRRCLPPSQLQPAAFVTAVTRSKRASMGPRSVHSPRHDAEDFRP